MKYFIGVVTFFIVALFPACAMTPNVGTGMGACRLLCQNEKTQLYKNDVEECRCSANSKATADFN